MTDLCGCVDVDAEGLVKGFVKGLVDADDLAEGLEVGGRGRRGFASATTEKTSSEKEKNRKF